MLWQESRPGKNLKYPDVHNNRQNVTELLDSSSEINAIDEQPSRIIGKPKLQKLAEYQGDGIPQ